MRHLLLPADQEPQALLVHRCKVRTPGDDGHVLTGIRQPDREIAADRARPEDADLHHASPSFSASPMRWSLPVAPFGISYTIRILPGTLNAASDFAAKSFSSRSVASEPSASTIAAATSSPSILWGIAKVTTCATEGCSISTSSTSRGEIFSPPRLMISLRRPLMVRKPSASISPWSPVRNQPSVQFSALAFGLFW